MIIKEQKLNPNQPKNLPNDFFIFFESMLAINWIITNAG